MGRLLQPTQGHGAWMSLAGGPVLVRPLLSLRVLCASGFLFGFDKVTCTAVLGCSEFVLVVDVTKPYGQTAAQELFPSSTWSRSGSRSSLPNREKHFVRRLARN